MWDRIAEVTTHSDGKIFSKYILWKKPHSKEEPTPYCFGGKEQYKAWKETHRANYDKKMR